MSDNNEQPKTIDSLTDEQIALIPVWREMYLNKFFANTHECTFEEVEEYMQWFYKRFEISENTPKVVLLDSPEAIAKLVALCKGANGGEIPSNDTKAVEAINTIVGNKNFIADHLSNEDMNEVVANFPSDMKPDWSESPAYYLSAFNSWVAFYDYFDKNTIVPLETTVLFNEYKKVLDLNIFWSVAFGNVVFVSKGITGYSRDENEEIRLHNVEEPSLTFCDGYGYYFIHGVVMKKEVFEAVKNETYTFDDFTKEENEETKNAILSMMSERWGDEYVFNFISSQLEQVDTYIDDKSEVYLEGTLLSTGEVTKGQTIGTYTLFKGTIGSNVQVAYVRCYCPSTDRLFFLGVEPSHEKADDAIASLLQIPTSVVNHISEIRRQGERYTVLFDAEGDKIYDELMAKHQSGEISFSESDLTTLSGKEYFSKVTYEY